MLWRENCLSVKESVEETIDPEFLQLLLLITGDEKTIENLSEYWTEWLCGIVLFVDPMITSLNFFEFGEKGLAKFGNATLLDEIMLAIFELNVSKVIQYSI